MKNIRFSGHSQEQLFYRGATEEEVIDSIHSSKWVKSNQNRMECRKDFLFNNIWNKKDYTHKQVRPIFIEEEKEIIVITVYTYFFNKE